MVVNGTDSLSTDVDGALILTVLEAPVGEVDPPLSVPRIQHDSAWIVQLCVQNRSDLLRIQIHQVDLVFTCSS